MAVDRELFELPGDFGGEVRLFPLPDLVLFPQNVQPLHIFESRYREMLEDALAGDQLIALATLKPGYEADYYSRPAVAPQICIGRVASHERTEDGRYNLILLGVKRALVVDEITPVRSFRRATVHLVDERPHAGDSPAVQSLGRELANTLADRLPAAKQLVDEFINQNVSLSTLTDVVAFHIPFNVDFKLSLLAESDPVARAQRLLQKLSEQSGQRAPGYRPPGFSNN
jgi:ATP-dependent Lon protease